MEIRQLFTIAILLLIMLESTSQFRLKKKKNRKSDRLPKRAFAATELEYSSRIAICRLISGKLQSFYGREMDIVANQTITMLHGPIHPMTPIRNNSLLINAEIQRKVNADDLVRFTFIIKAGESIAGIYTSEFDQGKFYLNFNGTRLETEEDLEKVNAYNYNGKFYLRNGYKFFIFDGYSVELQMDYCFYGFLEDFYTGSCFQELGDDLERPPKYIQASSKQNQSPPFAICQLKANSLITFYGRQIDIANNRTIVMAEGNLPTPTRHANSTPFLLTVEKLKTGSEKKSALGFTLIFAAGSPSAAIYKSALDEGKFYINYNNRRLKTEYDLLRAGIYHFNGKFYFPQLEWLIFDGFTTEVYVHFPRVKLFHGGACFL